MKPLLEHNFSARVLNAGLENDKGIFEPSVFDLNHESINEKYDQCLQRLREHDSRVFLEDYVPPTRSIGDATSSKHSKLSTPLRKRIEETIGKHILDKYWQKEGTRRPIIMAPIPESKFIDRLPQNEVSIRCKYTSHQIYNKYKQIFQVVVQSHEDSSFRKNRQALRKVTSTELFKFIWTFYCYVKTTSSAEEMVSPILLMCAVTEYCFHEIFLSQPQLFTEEFRNILRYVLILIVLFPPNLHR